MNGEKLSRMTMLDSWVAGWLDDLRRASPSSHLANYLWSSRYRENVCLS